MVRKVNWYMVAVHTNGTDNNLLHRPQPLFYRSSTPPTHPPPPTKKERKKRKEERIETYMGEVETVSQ